MPNTLLKSLKFHFAKLGLESKNPHRRVLAAKALADLGDRRALAPLIGRLEDEENTVLAR
jgi:HEAT repeat protein